MCCCTDLPISYFGDTKMIQSRHSLDVEIPLVVIKLSHSDMTTLHIHLLCPYPHCMHRQAEE